MKAIKKPLRIKIHYDGVNHRVPSFNKKEKKERNKSAEKEKEA